MEEPSPVLQSLRPASEADILHWEAVLKGVPGTAYEGSHFLPLPKPKQNQLSSNLPTDLNLSAGLWHLDILIPPSYPLAPPKITFTTPICHPNVDFKTGEICLDLLKTSWSPAYTLTSTLEAIHQLLAYPEVDSPFNVDIATLLKSGDKIGGESLVRFWCGEERWGGG